ncbi:MAG: LytTR family DNA-binding domain-containing protein [Ginsengibacter sp.]
MFNAKVIENENSDSVAPSKPDAAVRLDIHVKPNANRFKKDFSFISEEGNNNAVLNDVQWLNDFSVDLIKKVNISIPVILVTPKNEFLVTTIWIGSHGLLSKTEDNIHRKTFLKIDNLQKLLLDNLFDEKRKTRLIVKRGVANVVLMLNDIVFIYTKNRLVFVMDRNSKKYSIDKTLTELEEELNHTIFFRANRQYIINVNFIRSFKTYRKVKLLVDIDLPQLDEPVIISQQLAPSFKKWMDNA